MRLLIAMVVLSVPFLAQAQSTVTVVIKEAPPFVVKSESESGEWGGPAVNLWEQAASSLGLEFVYEEKTLKQMLDAVAAGEADAAVGALSVTAAREERFDFTHPFHNTGFGIATREVESGGWLAIIGLLFSKAFLAAAGALLLVLFLTGAAVAFVERRKNPEQFGGSWLQGLGSGFWWSAVTMTTVGYGDKAPVTLAGRVLALVWMFAAVITVSGFTAGIASSLTLEQLTAVDGAEDLAFVRVGTVEGSSSEEFLRGERIAPRTYSELGNALEALSIGTLDAVVYDLPLLAHQLERNPDWHAVSVLPGNISSQQYAFAVPAGSPLREQLNRFIPEFTSTSAWRDQVQGY